VWHWINWPVLWLAPRSKFTECWGPDSWNRFTRKALCVELSLRGIPFLRQVPVAVDDKGHPVGESRLDLVVGGTLVVELKAVDALGAVHSAQIISYLRATGHHLGLLINFNVPLLKEGIGRIVLS
jgi:GxxExxY protein